MVREEPWQLPKVLGRQEKRVSNMAVKQKKSLKSINPRKPQSNDSFPVLVRHKVTEMFFFLVVLLVFTLASNKDATTTDTCLSVLLADV